MESNQGTKSLQGGGCGERFHSPNHLNGESDDIRKSIQEDIMIRSKRAI